MSVPCHNQVAVQPSGIEVKMDDRFEPILKDVTVSLMSQVEVDGISGQDPRSKDYYEVPLAWQGHF